MATWLVTRHPGAMEWATRQGLASDFRVAHLALDDVGPGDTVIGVLPVGMAAAVCARGARYVHVDLSVDPEQRGRELDADEMNAFGARLRRYHVEGI